MKRSKLTLLWNAASSNLSSTVRASQLKRVIKDRRLSFSPCSMVSRLDEERLCLCPPIKLLTNNLLNSSKELTKLGGILLNHIRAGPLRVVGKALHIISSGTPWRCIIVLKVAMWSKGSHVPSYDLRKASWTSEGESDRWWVQWKGSQSYELNPPLDLSFLYSLSSHPWPFSSGPSPFPDVGLVNGSGRASLAHFYLAHGSNGLGLTGRWLVNGLGRAMLDGKTLARGPTLGNAHLGFSGLG